MIATRYLVRELARPLAAILGVLVALFASYTAAGFLSDAVNGLLPAGAILELIGLKLFISLEVLIPASLFVAVLLSFGRLYGDSEFAAMAALRLSPATQIRAVLLLGGALAALVGALSLFARPAAYQALHDLSARATTLLDVDAMEAGSFYVRDDGTRVIFLGHRGTAGGEARDVFIRLRRHDRTEIIHARLADEVPMAKLASGSAIYLTDAHIYEIERDRGQPDQTLQADGLVVRPDGRDRGPTGYTAVTAGSGRLARSHDRNDVAELQWRLSTPVSVLLLGLLAVPLSRSRPRQPRSGRFAQAIVVYFGYYLLCTSARTWVQHGTIGAFPGIWWAPALLALLFALLMYRPSIGPGRARLRPA